MKIHAHTDSSMTV